MVSVSLSGGLPPRMLRIRGGPPARSAIRGGRVRGGPRRRRKFFEVFSAGGEKNWGGVGSIRGGPPSEMDHSGGSRSGGSPNPRRYTGDDSRSGARHLKCAHTDRPRGGPLGPHELRSTDSDLQMMG